MNADKVTTIEPPAAETMDEPVVRSVQTPSAPVFSWKQARGWWIGAVAASLAIAFVLDQFAGRQGTLIPVFTFGLCVVATWLDAATRRIPNVLTYPPILIAFFLTLVLEPVLRALGLPHAAGIIGSPGPASSLQGFMLCAMIGIVSFMARGLGGGDVKLLAGVGALLGLAESIPVLFNTLACAAILGVASWALKGQLAARAQIVSLSLLQAAATKRGISKAYPFKRSEAPFGISLLIGFITAPFFAVHEPILHLIGWYR